MRSRDQPARPVNLKTTAKPSADRFGLEELHAACTLSSASKQPAGGCRDGRSRQFGFVGFVDVNQAEDAINYFDNSYLDTARITVKVGCSIRAARVGSWPMFSLTDD